MSEGLSPQEIAEQEGAELPDREAMSALTTPLLDVDANLDLALDLAAPVDAAVAANANAALPVDAAVSANVLSPDGTSVASAPQDSVVSQSLEGEANATANQTAAIGQDGGTAAADAGGQAAGTETTPEAGGQA